MPENVTPLPEDPELTRLRAALADAERLVRQCAMYAMDADKGDELAVAEIAVLTLEQIPDFVSDRLADLECRLARKDAELERWEKRWEELERRHVGEIERLKNPSLSIAGEWVSGYRSAVSHSLEEIYRLTPAPNSGDAAGE